MPTPASSSSMAAATGPPNRAEIAENVPAVESTLPSASPNRAQRATTRPTMEPRAKSGASGPSTAPKASEPIAASMTPGACEIGVGATAIPPSGSWPPSPGSNARAARTMSAPASGRPTTRYQGGPDAPRLSGRSTHSQCSSSWTVVRKSAAASAAGIPMRAPRPTRRSARSLDMAEAASGELTLVRAPPRRPPSARREAPASASGSALSVPPAAPDRAARRTRRRGRRRA